MKRQQENTTKVTYETFDPEFKFCPMVDEDLNTLKERVAANARGEHLVPNASEENREYWRNYYESLTYVKVTTTREAV